MWAMLLSNASGGVITALLYTLRVFKLAAPARRRRDKNKDAAAAAQAAADAENENANNKSQPLYAIGRAPIVVRCFTLIPRITPGGNE